MNEAADMLVIGGGPVGATLALALHGSGLDVGVLEARADAAPPTDPRAIALSYGSRLILQHLGVWDALAPATTPIHTIHISQQSHLGRSVLTAEEANLPELGCVVDYCALYGVLAGALQASGIPVLYAAQANAIETAPDAATVSFTRNGAQQKMRAALLTVADGGRSMGEIPGIHREVRDYGQAAVVARVETELPHGHVAYERFTPRGPLALLPWGDRAFALVWTETPEAAQALSTLDETEFLQRLHEHFGDRQGRFIKVQDRGVFPLKLARAQPVTAERLAVIGNAAQTLHPVAGQGFNIGLRDAWELAQIIRATPPHELGSAAMLAHYRSARRPDTFGGILFTDFLVRTFSNDIPGLGGLRGCGLTALELLAPAKRLVVGKMSFGARG
jgi:2-octaprenyl-6-methoxyphenol hydroxylase